MRIVVCIKRVVDTETRVKVAGDGTSIDMSGVQFVMAPYDEMAVEKAIQRAKDEHVTLGYVGNDRLAKVCRRIGAVRPSETGDIGSAR